MSATLAAPQRKGAILAAAMLWAWAGAAHAEPRTVAVVNGAADQQAGARLAEALGTAVDAHPELAMARGELGAALSEPLARRLGAEHQLLLARASMNRAASELALLHYDLALDELARTEELLLAMEPAPAVTDFLAQVAFWRGIIHGRDARPGPALEEFFAARRLDPARARLDPVRHPPEEIALYDRAGAARAATAAIEVTAPVGAEVFLNGRKAGVAPVRLAVAPGIHYVSASQPGIRVMGRRVVATDGQTAGVALRFGRMSVEELLRDQRRRLVDRAPVTSVPDARIVELARAVAKMARVDAVLIIGNDLRGELVVGFYANGRLSPWRRVAGVDASAVVAPLAARPEPVAPVPRRRLLAPRMPEPGPLRPMPAWVKATFGVAAVAALVGITAFSLRTDSDPVLVPGSTCCVVDTGP